MATKPQKPNRRTPRSSAATVAKRVEQIADLRLAGATARDLFRFASENRWNVGERQIEKYITAADKLLEKCIERDRKKRVIDHLNRRRNLYARALQVGDYRAALAAARDEALLMGLYPTAEVKHGGDPKGVTLAIVTKIVRAKPASPEQAEQEAA